MRHESSVIEVKNTDTSGAVKPVGKLRDKYVQVYGTWNGATITVEGRVHASATTWKATSGGTLTSDGVISVPETFADLRLTTSGAGGSTSLTAYIAGFDVSSD
mgnify:FL=1